MLGNLISCSKAACTGEREFKVGSEWLTVERPEGPAPWHILRLTITTTHYHSFASLLRAVTRSSLAPWRCTRALPFSLEETVAKYQLINKLLFVCPAQKAPSILLMHRGEMWKPRWWRVCLAAHVPAGSGGACKLVIIMKVFTP